MWQAPLMRLLSTTSQAIACSPRQGQITSSLVWVPGRLIQAPTTPSSVLTRVTRTPPTSISLETITAFLETGPAFLITEARTPSLAPAPVLLIATDPSTPSLAETPAISTPPGPTTLSLAAWRAITTPRVPTTPSLERAPDSQT